MTVAAVILAASPGSALADADGTPGARRLANTAWAGGATPVVICAADPDGAIARALGTAEATLVAPVAAESGPVGQIVNGIEAAVALVAETDAALVWPARMAWVDAETVTTLIAAHGTDRRAVIRPGFEGEPGWPVLVPLACLAALRALPVTRMPGELLDDLAASGVAWLAVETGDPGVVHDIGTPRALLPPFDGPPRPADTHAHEWGTATADEPDEPA